MAKNILILSENLQRHSVVLHPAPFSIFYSTTHNAMWKPSNWGWLVLAFEFFQHTSNISFNNRHRCHPLCSMTSRPDLQDYFSTTVQFNTFEKGINQVRPILKKIDCCHWKLYWLKEGIKMYSLFVLHIYSKKSNKGNSKLAEISCVCY